jgi:hypothetical protein
MSGGKFDLNLPLTGPNKFSGLRIDWVWDNENGCVDAIDSAELEVASVDVEEKTEN